MKLQLPHFREGLCITPNAGSVISAFYAASVSLVNGSVFAVMPTRISLTLPAHGPQAKIQPIQTNGLPLFCLLSNKLAKSFLQNLVVMNGLSMGQLLPRQFRKSRARAQILLLTLRSLHLATSSHLWLYFPSPCFTARKQ